MNFLLAGCVVIFQCFQRDCDKVVELKSKLQYISDREQAARDEMQELYKELDQHRNSTDDKLLSLQKDKQQMEEEMQQVGICAGYWFLLTA